MGLTWDETERRVVNMEALVDLREVKIDRALPKEERLQEFVRQIQNPYCFKYGDFTIKLRFAEKGGSLEDALTAFLSL